MTQPSAEAVRSFPEDCLPPERDYESREALCQAINEWALPRGYAFTTGRSAHTSSGRQTVQYACDRWRRPPSDSRDRRRLTPSRGTNCPFSINAKQSLDKTTWSVKHRPDSRYAFHNHEPSQHPSSHPAHRKLSSQEKSTIINLANAGTSPKDIWALIRQNPDSFATRQDIYNCISENKRFPCVGPSVIHTLAEQLDKEGFWNRMQFDQNGRVTAVLFAHPDSLASLRLENFHTPWRPNRISTTTLLLEPRIRSDQISAGSTRTQSSTPREPSALAVNGAATQPSALAVHGAAIQPSAPAVHGAAIQPSAPAVHGAAIQPSAPAVHGAAIQPSALAVNGAAIQPSGTTTLQLEPRHRSDQISAGSTRTQSSTPREPSALAVNGAAIQPSALAVHGAAIQPRAQPKCSGCHQLGHAMTSKLCPLRQGKLLQSSALPAAPAAPASPVSEGDRSVS